MIGFIRAVLCILLLASPQAFAGINNPGSGSGSSGATGSAQLNLGAGDFIPANVINVLKTAGESFATPSDAGKIDDEGYLTSSPTGNVSLSFPVAGTMWSGTTYRLRVDAGVTFTNLVFNFIAASCTASNGNITFTGCVGGTTTVASNGSGGTLTFTTATGQFSLVYLAGGTHAHTLGAALSLYRLSDETAFLAGEIFKIGRAHV